MLPYHKGSKMYKEKINELENQLKTSMADRDKLQTNLKFITSRVDQLSGAVAAFREAQTMYEKEQEDATS